MILDFFKCNPYLEPFFPFPYAFLAEIKMQGNYAQLDRRSANIHTRGHDPEEFFEIIKLNHTNENERKEIIEDKSKASLFVITLSLTFILSSLTFIYTKVVWVIPKVLVLTPLILGVVFLLLSGMTAIKALFIKGYNDLYLDGRLSGEYENLEIVTRTQEEEINLLYECIKLNEILTNIKANFVDSTFIGIRNAITLIGLFFLLAVFNLLLI